MATYPTKLAEGFSQRLLKEIYDKSLTDVVVNRDYQGEINEIGSILNILNFDRISERTYTGANLAAPTDLTENNAQLVINQYKSFYWKEDTLDKWLSYIKEPHATIVDQVAGERNRNMDIFVLGHYGDVAAGNRVGTDVTGGTVQVDAAGAVIGTGGVFTNAMVGRGFRATGHTQWYRVRTWAGVNNITIEDDLNDVATQYTGAVILAGANYTIEAATPLAITTANLLQRVSELKQKLDIADRNQKSSVPDSDRWLIVPPEFETLLVRASGIALHVPDVYTDLIKRGFITELQGFKVYKSNRLTGNNTAGFRVLAGHPNWCTFAEKVLQARMEEDVTANFGTAYKDLFVYGAKVTDSRRHFATEGYWTF